MKNNNVEKLTIITPDGTIFDTESEYVIPLYQRAFSWEEKQLLQFLEDIQDMDQDDEAHYYIGSLIVSREGNCFEVVDGQQRLTTLYLLLSCLGVRLGHTLTFACRDNSNYTLKKLRDLLSGNPGQIDPERIDAGLHQGARIISERISRPDFNQKDFLKKLERVILYRIQVPEHTDLNRYFEIMNTRGEQLEQHDILKAALMSYLPEDKERAAFARIWEACSDMTGYVQMHFSAKEREWIFGAEWGELPSCRWEDLKPLAELNEGEGEGFSIAQIVKKSFPVSSADDTEQEDGGRIRFESIIEFPYFLLHVLKVLVRVHSIRHMDGERELLNELLDDKKLLDSFDQVIKQGVKGKRRLVLGENKKLFSRWFILCLLRSRFLFDKYIIKREFVNDDSDGQWSLKELRVSGARQKKRPYYTNTRLVPKKGWDSTNDRQARKNIMIQSALRVSYTSPKVMHWITTLLSWLSKNDCANVCEECLAEYDMETEKIAKKAVRENFFQACPKEDYSLGVNTPHIVFNYLDYLIWKGNSGKYHDFTFEFRNSVEHWYPRNPSGGTFEPWSDGVDRFGNLCIIQRSVNSRFSNLSPEAKKSTFYEMIGKGSLKLQMMSRMTRGADGQPANVCWKNQICEEHEREMIWMLKQACGIEKRKTRNL